MKTVKALQVYTRLNRQQNAISYERKLGGVVLTAFGFGSMLAFYLRPQYLFGPIFLSKQIQHLNIFDKKDLNPYRMLISRDSLKTYLLYAC